MGKEESKIAKKIRFPKLKKKSFLKICVLCTGISRVLASSGFFLLWNSFSRIFFAPKVFLHPWKLTHPCTVSLSIMPWCWFPVSQNRIWMFQVMLWQWQIVFNRPKLFRITAWGTNDDKTLFNEYFITYFRVIIDWFQ